MSKTILAALTFVGLSQANPPTAFVPPRAYDPPKAIVADSPTRIDKVPPRDIYKLDLSGIDASKPFYVAEGRWHRPEPNEILAPGMKFETKDGLVRQVRVEVPVRPFGSTAGIKTITDADGAGQTYSSRQVQGQLPDRIGIGVKPVTFGFGTTTNNCPT